MFLRRRLIFQQAETIYALEPLLDQKLIGNRVLKIINRSVLCMFHSNSTWFLRNHLFYISLNQIYYSLRRIGTMNVIEDHQLIIPVNISFTGCVVLVICPRIQLPVSAQWSQRLYVKVQGKMVHKNMHKIVFQSN